MKTLTYRMTLAVQINVPDDPPEELGGQLQERLAACSTDARVGHCLFNALSAWMPDGSGLIARTTEVENTTH